MSRRLLFLPLCAALPALLCAQEPKLINCRTLESAGNFVGPDEVIVDDMVCQKAKPGANASAPPAQPKAVPGVVISDADGGSVVDAARAANQRVAAAKDAIKEKQNSEQVTPAAPAEPSAPSAPESTTVETPATPVPPSKVPETAPPAPKQPMKLPAKGPRSEVAEDAPQPSPETVSTSATSPAAPANNAPPSNAAGVADKGSRSAAAEPAMASSHTAAPVVAPEPASASVPAESAAASTPPAAAPAPVQKTPSPESARTEAAAPAQAAGGPPSETLATSAPEVVLKSSTPAPEPGAEPPTAPSENNPRAPAVAETAKSAEPARAAEPTKAAEAPAVGGTGFYDANAGTNVVTIPRPEDVAAAKAAAEPKQPTAEELAAAAAAKAAAEEAEASLRAPDPNLPRERVVETGAFAEPKEVGADPTTLARKTNFQPGDNEGFEEGHRADCTKNVTIGGLKGEKLVLGTPDWAIRWVERNQKRMPRICFSDTPMTTAKNYLVVFYTAPATPEGVKPADASETPQGAPAGGVGAFTLSYGSTWHYAQERNVGVTVLTRDEADEPQAEMAKVWYATAYTEEGVPVSEHWPEKNKKPIQLDEKDTKSKKAKEARAEIERVADELLDQMVGDIAKL